MDFGHEIDGQDECILDFVRNFRLKIINYIHLYLNYEKIIFDQAPNDSQNFNKNTVFPHIVSALE